MHAHKSGESGFCTSLFSNHLVCASVSIFFILSGMFLFKKDLMNPKVYIEICRKRLRSLVIPFLFWNFIILSVAIVFLFVFPYTFMVYALHEPFMSLTAKIFTRTIHSDGLGMLFYFVSPIFSILLCILIGICWKRLHPFSYHFSTGGR